MGQTKGMTNDTETRPRTVGGFPTVPTTKVLANARLLAPLTPEQRKRLMPHEVPETVRLFLAGKIDQWWSRQDGKGPVFLLNAGSVHEAKELMASLPLEVAGPHGMRFYRIGTATPSAFPPHRRMGARRVLKGSRREAAAAV